MQIHLHRFAEALARLQLDMAAAAVFAILFAISLDVILRATVSSPFSSTFEIVSFYCMIPVVFLPVMYLEISGGHIDTDLFYRLFSRRMKLLSFAVSGILSTGIYGVLAYVTFKQAIVSTHSGEVSMGVNLLPIWPVRWVLPFVFGISTCAAAMLSFKRIFRGGDDA